MAETATNRYLYLLATGGIVPGTTDLRIGLLKTLAGHTNVADLNFVSEMEAHADFAELTAGGYARVALTGEAATEDDTNNRALIDANDVSFGNIAAGETIRGAFLYIHTGTDSTAALLAIHDLTVTATNGGLVSITTAAGLTQLV